LDAETGSLRWKHADFWSVLAVFTVPPVTPRCLLARLALKGIGEIKMCQQLIRASLDRDGSYHATTLPH
jgi:hypothetical protein